ncbi:5-hydroxytryptamine receptor-like [Diadema antillarum]|uniref:5-hydroxytryptamine receptor-like n=1 Tax=Diadema antillarum TaxID=105358 RepID=UPI003A8C4216
MRDQMEIKPSASSIVVQEQNEEKALQALSLSIILFCALVFNSVTIFVILRTRSLRQNLHNLLMLNLAVADLGVALASMTFSMGAIFDEGRYLESHRAVCKVSGFLAIGFSFTNLPLIFSIAFDRFLVVVCSSRRSPPKRLRIGLLIGMSWAVGFFVATMGITGWLSEFRYNMYTKHCTPVWTNKGFRILCVVLNYGITIPSLVFFYAVITFYLRRERLQLEAYEITRSTYTPKSSFPVDRSETPEVDWSSSQV